MEKWQGFDFGVETVTTVTVNNNCQTYLPRNRFSRCSTFCFKLLFCVLYLPSADTPHAPSPPLLLHPLHHHRRRRQTRILSRYLQKVLQGTECEGLGGVAGKKGGEVRGEGEWRRRRGGRDYLGPSSAVQPPTSFPLLLLLPIMEPWGPREAALCLAAMQPLYHSNLLIVGAQLAHGGFLLEPPNID